jgi:hypothetical protein
MFPWWDPAAAWAAACFDTVVRLFGGYPWWG